ncbi:MAG: Fic family protein [Stellaceae bacterium]
MPAPHEKLAESLSALHDLQKAGRRVFKSSELTRVHRERLIKNGFLQEVLKGWLITSGPDTRAGDSTPWYASFWEFCARYCDDRFGDQWYLSPEQSLLIQAENTVIPAQLIVNSPKGANHDLKLLFGVSLYDLKQAEMPSPADLIVRDGLRLFSTSAALVKAPEAFFSRRPIESQVALANLKDVSEVLRRLLDRGQSVVAGRLAGAFRRIGRADAAEEILKTMKAANYDVRESDPFTPQQTFGVLRATTTAPIVTRMQALWQAMRKAVLDAFPKAPGSPKDKSAYLGFIDEIYVHDAYHSLSIEGYRVTPELIERVRSGAWNPAGNEADRKSRDALAARGYWQAFQLVKSNIAEIINGANPGALVRGSHRDWYRELFQPCVAAGLLPASALAGYRNDAVYLRTSRYVPPRWEAVRDAMPAFFDLLEQEEESAVRATLGHWLFGYIHPYPDGNGRMARFLMNAMLASGGYPWTVVRVEDRKPYLAALDAASIDSDMKPFARFIAARVEWSSTTAQSGGPPQGNPRKLTRSRGK